VLNLENKMKLSKSKRCIKSEADMLKNPAKAIKFYSDTHDNTPLIPPLIRGELGGCAFCRKAGWIG
jgi:hypothetical protein